MINWYVIECTYVSRHSGKNISGQEDNWHRLTQRFPFKEDAEVYVEKNATEFRLLRAVPENDPAMHVAITAGDIQLAVDLRAKIYNRVDAVAQAVFYATNGKILNERRREFYLDDWYVEDEQVTATFKENHEEPDDMDIVFPSSYLLDDSWFNGLWAEYEIVRQQTRDAEAAKERAERERVEEKNRALRRAEYEKLKAEFNPDVD